MKTCAYLRVSTDKQDVANQKLSVLDHAQKIGLRIDQYIEIIASSRRTQAERRIDELMQVVAQGDTLIVSELSRLGRSIIEIISLVNELVQRKIRLICVKEGIDLIGNGDLQSKIMITLFSIMAEIERDLISRRTKDALAARKRNGVILGRRKGTQYASKFDADKERIVELLGYGLSINKIAKVLKLKSSRGLRSYIKTRKLLPSSA